MPASRQLSNYADIKGILDAAIAAGGATYRLATPGKATNWRQRANVFRSLFRGESQKANSIPGLVVSVPYEDWEWVVDEADKCLIIIRPQVAKGVLKDMDGNDLAPKTTSVVAPQPELDPDLVEQASDLVKRLSL